MKMISLLLIITSLSFGQKSIWNDFGEMKKPVAGASLYKNPLTNEIFVLGGFSDSTQSNINWIQILDQNLNNIKIDSLYTPRFGLVTAEYNNLLYTFGGVNDSLEYASILESWETKNAVERTIKNDDTFNRNFSIGHVIGNRLYVIGGSPNKAVYSENNSYITEYNLDQSNITFQSDSLFVDEDLPEQQMYVTLGNVIYIFGGVINGISQNIYKFNTIDHQFKKLETKLIIPRAGGKAVYSEYSNEVFIIGGYNEDSLALKSVEILSIDGENIAIRNGSPIQKARYHFMTCLIGYDIYIMGGFDSEKNVIKTIEKYAFSEVTSEKENYNIPNNKFKLFQNFPNPFNPVTNIKYQVSTNSNSHSQNTTLTIFNSLGEKIITLVDKNHASGIYSVSFDASNLPSGIYYYQLTSDTFLQTKKMILLK